MDDSIGVVSGFVLQLFWRTVLYDFIRYAQDNNPCSILMGCHKFQNGRAKTTDYRSIFHSDNLFKFLKHFMKQGFVEWFHKAQVIVCSVQVHGPQLTDGSSSEIAGMAKTQYDQFLSIFYFSAFTDFNFLEW